VNREKKGLAIKGTEKRQQVAETTESVLQNEMV